MKYYYYYAKELFAFFFAKKYHSNKFILKVKCQCCQYTRFIEHTGTNLDLDVEQMRCKACKAFNCNIVCSEVGEV